MLINRSAWCVGLAAVVLSGCSSTSMSEFRQWWTEDLRGPRDAEWQDAEPVPYRTERGDGRDMADEQSEPEIFEQDASPPRTASGAVRPRPPTARVAKPGPRVAQVQPSPMPPPPPPSLPPPERPLVPTSIVTVAGMTEDGVRGALGSPHEEAQKGSQKVWIYRGNGCSVEVSFFLDVTRNTYAALDHKTRGADGRTAMTGPCLQSTAVLQDLDR